VRKRIFRKLADVTLPVFIFVCRSVERKLK
jgi:hypothetical protein